MALPALSRGDLDAADRQAVIIALGSQEYGLSVGGIGNSGFRHSHDPRRHRCGKTHTGVHTGLQLAVRIGKRCLNLDRTRLADHWVDGIDLSRQRALG
ncbi:hypothetical protein D3C80_1696900 [compost metagenome]